MQKLEKFFHTRYAEPIRSGLDRRSTHLVLLKDRAEYEAWWQAMFELFGEQFDEKDNPGGNAHFREVLLKGPGSGFVWGHFSVWYIGKQPLDRMHRSVVADLAIMYYSQLGKPRRRPAGIGPLQTGFANLAETAIFGSPSVVYGAIVYHQDFRFPVGGGRAWTLLVRQRVAGNRATPLAELLKMDHSKMSQSNYAEAWRSSDC